MFWRKKKKTKSRSAEDRRREPRLEDSNQITVALREVRSGKPETRTYYAQTLNASPSGMQIQTDSPLPVGSLLTVKLHSRKIRKLIQATGRVKWVMPIDGGRAWRVGLEFVETPIRAIMDLLDHIYKA